MCIRACFKKLKPPSTFCPQHLLVFLAAHTHGQSLWRCTVASRTMRDGVVVAAVHRIPLSMLMPVMLLTLVRLGVAMVMLMMIVPLLLSIQKILAFKVFTLSRVDHGFVFFSMGLWVHERTVSKVDRQAGVNCASGSNRP